MKKGLFWQREGERVRCQLCPHSCLLAAGQRGMCFGRENREGELLAATYGRVSSCAVDPVEKKPLYHFFQALWCFLWAQWAATSHAASVRTGTFPNRRLPQNT